MTVQQLEHLADGLSVSACGQTLVVDRMRAGTDLAPRVHLAPNRLASASWEEMSDVLRHVVTRVACGGRV